MKRAIYLITILLITGLLIGCSKEKTESNNENQYSQTEELTDSDNNGEDEIQLNSIELSDIKEIDYTYDYTEDIKADVEYVVSNSSSLQEELKNIDKIIEKYTVLAESATAQMEMNMASKWFYVIWDTELNNLWSRFSDLADQDTKDRVLEEQRNWIAMKEEVTLMSLGSSEENGSMYPLLVNSLWEEKTKTGNFYFQD